MLDKFYRSLIIRNIFRLFRLIIFLIFALLKIQHSKYNKKRKFVNISTLVNHIAIIT